MVNKKFDIVDFVIGFENGSFDDADIIEGFQYLINKGIVWTLQGFYGRIAKALIEQGFCKPANQWTPQEARKHFEENYIIDTI